MSFFRPEAQQILHRWRDVIIGGAIVGVGTYWSFSAGPVLKWFAVLMIVGGGALLWEGFRRARLPAGGGGPGVVEVTERQITYLSSSGGYILSIDDLQRVVIQSSGTGFIWQLHSDGQGIVQIPGNAEGADKLYDAFSALPGANIELAIDAAQSTQRDIFLIWQQDRRRLH